MTGRRVLKDDKVPLSDDLDEFGRALPDWTKGDIITRLQEVATKLTEAKKLNDQMQGQFASGSASWYMCESIDDKLHEIAVLLGE